jgi:hypothetical protein
MIFNQFVYEEGGNKFLRNIHHFYNLNGIRQTGSTFKHSFRFNSTNSSKWFSSPHQLMLLSSLQLYIIATLQKYGKGEGR